MDIWTGLIGVFLGWVLGFFTRFYWERRSLKNQDKDALTVALRKAKRLNMIWENKEGRNSHIETIDDLLQLSYKFSTKKYKDIAFEMRRFAEGKRDKNPDSAFDRRLMLDSIEEMRQKVADQLNKYYKEQV